MAMTAMQTATVKLYWTDKDGGVAITHIHVPFSLGYEDAYSRANAIASAMQALSTAVLSRIVVQYRWAENDRTLPETVGEAETAWGLFYRNGEDFYAFYIPAPNLALAEGTGLYAQVRLDVSNPYVASSLQELVLALGQAVTDEGVPTGLGYWVGGLAI